MHRLNYNQLNLRDFFVPQRKAQTVFVIESSKVTTHWTVMQVLGMVAQQCSVYTHRIFYDDTFVNFIEFFCICPVHVELWKTKTLLIKNRCKNDFV